MEHVAHVLAQLQKLARSIRSDVCQVDTAFRALMLLSRELRSPHTLTGLVAVIHHGYERYGAELEMLVGRDALEELNACAANHEFMFSSRRCLIHVPTQVRIMLHASGDRVRRGDDVWAYPSPEALGTSERDRAFVSLRGLMELKLHSRYKQDLADVTELLKKMDDASYVTLESGLSPELRDVLAGLRRGALEELEAERQIEQDDDGT